MGLNAWVAVIFAKQTCIKKFKSQRTTPNEPNWHTRH